MSRIKQVRPMNNANDKDSEIEEIRRRIEHLLVADLPLSEKIAIAKAALEIVEADEEARRPELQ